MARQEIQGPATESPFDKAARALNLDLSDFSPVEVQAIREVFSILTESGGDPQQRQRRLEEVAKGVVAASAPLAYPLLLAAEKARDLSPLKHLTYEDNLQFLGEILDPRGITDPKKGMPLSGQRILSAGQKLGRKMKFRSRRKKQR